MSNSSIPTWSTSDLALAAFLQVKLDVEPDVEPQSGRYCTFAFPDSDELGELVAGWGRNPTIDAQRYSKALSDLKYRAKQAAGGAR